VTTIANELDQVQRVLQDAQTLGEDGALWTRAELLDWWIDGYRHLLAETSATRRLTVLSIPPEFSWSCTFPWEQQCTGDGSAFVWAQQGEGGWAASHLWELEVLEGYTPTAAGETVFTHPFERQFAQSQEQHFTFAIPRDTERIIKVYYDHRLLLPVVTRRLDALETSWYSLEGTPLVWTRGLHPGRTFDVYAVVTTEQRVYRQVDAVSNEGNPLHGTLRRMSGSRTYRWTSDSGDSVPYGIARRISSPDRDYLWWTASPDNVSLGQAGWVTSSTGNLLVLEARIPDQGTLTEDDTPGLLPPQVFKYVQWYVLWRAFSRQGEGQNPAMAAFCETWVQRGIQFLRQLHQLARKDRQGARAPVTPGRGRPARVSLPPSYPRVWR
jgi:hypothetical protein